jgi:glycerate dehydrogenase
MSNEKIVVLDGHTLNPDGDNPWTSIENLGETKIYPRTNAQQIVERSIDAQTVITNKVQLTAQTLRQLPRLRLIAVAATGYNIVDIAAANSLGIAVANVPVYGTSNVAQFTFALLLELCHRIGLHDTSVKQGDWESSSDWCYWKAPQVELAGRTIGLVGFGRIGRRVGEIANAFGMNVIAVQRRDSAPAYAPFAWRSIEQLFTEADVVSLHCPQTPESAGMVNRQLLAKMKSSAFLINTSRGGLINESDLADALNNGRLRGAAVDVLSSEPARSDNPLLHARNCIITPHVAWATLEARQRIMQTVASNISAFRAAKPLNVVNASDLRPS